MNALTKAAQDVLAERQRQVSVEGWTPEHDDQHGDGSMAQAAACYAATMASKGQSESFDSSGGRGDSPVWSRRSFRVPLLWPMSWHAEWWKPKDRRRNLVRAAALLLAEIERIDRAAEAKPKWKPCARCTTPDYCTNQLRGCDISESLEAGIAPLAVPAPGVLGTGDQTFSAHTPMVPKEPT